MTHVRKLWLLLVFATVLALVAAACSPATALAPTAAPAAKVLKVGLLSPGPVQDKGWNQLAYDGLMAIKDQLGAEVSYVELPESPSEFEKAFTDYASQGYDLVIGHGFQFQDAALKVATQFPDTVFVTSGGTNVAPNLAPIVMRHEEAMYLLGIIAAGMSETGKAVGIGGMDIPAISGTYQGFEASFEATAGNEFSVTYLNSWTDIGAAKEATLAAYAAGADIVLPNANIAGQGVFQAAQEQDKWTFGTNADQSSLAPDNILANTVLDYTAAFIAIAESVRDGKFVGNQPVSFGLKDADGKIVYITYNPKVQDQIPADVQAAVETAKAKIISGEIVVPGSY